MDQSRRSLLRKVTAGAVVFGLAGCLNDESEPVTTETGTDPPSVGEFSTPNPVITTVKSPTPSIEETSEETIEDETDRYTGLLSNTGAAGDVSVELYWAKNQESLEKEDMTFVSSKQIPVEEESDRTFAFSETRPEEYEGYWFFVSPVTVTVELRNNGGAGDVLVTLFDGGQEVDTTTIRMESGANAVAELQNDTVTGEIAFDVQAKPAKD